MSVNIYKIVGTLWAAWAILFVVVGINASEVELIVGGACQLPFAALSYMEGRKP